MCMCAKSLQSCLTLQTSDCSPTRLLCSQDSLGKNTGVVAMPSSRRFFLTQGWKLMEPASLMSPALTSMFFTTSATWEAQLL